MRNRISWLIVIAVTSLLLAATGCGGGSNLSTGTTSTPTVKSVTVNAQSAMNVGAKQPLTCSLAMSDGTTVNAGNCTYTSSNVSVATIDATNNLVANAAGTTNVTAANSGVTSSPLPVTVSQPAGVTGVSVTPSSATVTDVQSFTFTFAVSATGGAATTANLTVSPSGTGTLSATSNVPSGTQVTFTPAATGAGSATITVTATADATQAATIDVTITKRTIAISLAHYVAWLPICAGILNESGTQTGVITNDVLHMFPYPSANFTQTPSSTFGVSLGINSSYTTPNSDGTTRVCSPGAYDFNVTGADGSVSNHQYLLVAPPYNQWAGYNSTDEFVADYAGNQTCKFKLADGSADGCIPHVSLKELVDGNYLLQTSSGVAIAVYDLTTSQYVTANSEAGDSITDFSVANGIVGYAGANYPSGSSGPAQEKVAFFREVSSDSTVTDYPISSGTPTLIGMTTACMSGSNTATAAVWDSQALAVRRLDVTAPSSGTMTVDDSKGVVAIPFANSTEVPDTTAPRHLVMDPKSCRATMLGPVLDSNASAGYDMVIAVIDLANMNVLATTTVASQPIPATAMELVTDPSGNAVIVDSADTTAGNSPVERISWSVDSLGTLTFAAAQKYTGGSPVGVYGVALGIQPNGTVSVGQRGKVSHLAPSTLAPLQ